MAKTTAERQAAYRASRDCAGDDGNGERRLSAWVNTSTYYALGRLARHYGVTRREVVERLITVEDTKILAGMKVGSNEEHEYLR